MTMLMQGQTSTTGETVIVLHGGPGPGSVAGIAQHLAVTRQVFLPTHPGWDGTPRDAETDSAAALASQYLDEITTIGLSGVTLVGHSFGGWIATELAVQDAERGRHLIERLVLIDSVGVDVPGVTVQPFTFEVPPGLPDQQRALFEAMRPSMEAYLAHGITDPSLSSRIHTVTIPVTVIWGADDDIIPLDYGRLVAQAFSEATFIEIANAGHAPQLQKPDQTAAAIDRALDSDSSAAPSKG